MEIKRFLAQREPFEGEYIQDNLIYCANCKTPRQMYYKQHYLPTMCECEQIKDAEEKAQAQKEKTERRRELFIRIPEYRKYRFSADDGQSPRTKTICERYVDKFEEMRSKGMGLLFFGDVGTGKTFYEYCIANALIDRGYSVTVTSLVSIVDEAMKSKELFDKVIEGYLGRDLLIIDDIGTQRETGFSDEKVHKFIDACYASKTPIIASTNLDVDAMQSEVDGKLTNNSRIYDRLLERCYPIRLTSVRRRAQKREQNRAEMEQILLGGGA